MDYEQSTQPSQPEVIKTKQFNYKKYAIVCLVIALVTISLAGSYYLYSRRTQPVATQQAQEPYIDTNQLPNDFNRKLQDGPFTCPVDKSYCQAKDNFRDSALKITLRQTTSLVAAFDGEIEVFSKKAKTHGSPPYKQAILTNKDRGLKAYYYFNGEASVSGQIKEGARIGRATVRGLTDYNNYSFVFELMKVTSGYNTGNLTNFQIGDFK